MGGPCPPGSGPGQPPPGYYGGPPNMGPMPPMPQPRNVDMQSICELNTSRLMVRIPFTKNV